MVAVPVARTTAYFDPKTGELARLKQMDYPAAEGDTEKVINLTNVRDEDRVILLPTGPAELTIDVFPEGAIQYPPNYVVQLKSVEERIDIAPGENQRTFQLPEDIVSAARSNIQAAKTNLELRSRRPFGGRMPRRASSKEAAKSEPLGDRCRLIVKLTSETKDGPPPEGARVELHDETNSRVPVQRRRRSLGFRRKFAGRKRSRCDRPVRTGALSLGCQFSRRPTSQQRLPLMKPGEERTLDIICPPPAKKTTVLITAPPVPEDLRGSGVPWSADFYQQPMSFEGHDWYLASQQERNLSVRFNPATGLVTQANITDVSEDAPEDRLLIVTAGNYRLSYAWHRTLPREETQPRKGEDNEINLRWPDEEHAADPEFQFTAEPGENTWAIKVPDEFWAAARKKLAEASADKE